MAAAAILKNQKIAPSRQRFDRSAQHLPRLCILAQVDPPNRSGTSNFKLLKIKHGGRPPFWKSEKWPYISATVWPIDTAFGMITHIGTPNRTGIWNFELLKIQNGGWPPSWKIEKCSINVRKIKNCDISATVWPIATKVEMVTQFDTLDASDR